MEINRLMISATSPISGMRPEETKDVGGVSNKRSSPPRSGSTPPGGPSTSRCGGSCREKDYREHVVATLFGHYCAFLHGGAFHPYCRLGWTPDLRQHCLRVMFERTLIEPWLLDMDSTVKTLYGHQEGAEVGYNRHKPGRGSHAYHTYMLSSLRLVLRVDVLPGDEYNVAQTDELRTLLDHPGPARRPALLRGDKSWGIEQVKARAEQNRLAYLSACV